MLGMRQVHSNCIIIQNCMASSKQWHAATINEHLTSKYDIHFNFFFTKPTNEILFNHTTAPATLTFKDAVIFADNNDYLKRYYFLKNSQDKDQIFDRINLLAQFYGSAVLLRYQYPLMVLTKTKSVFLKRLKRMKKILVEQGSSDESNSDRDQRAVSINSSQFLKSLSSSQLERKSLDQDHRLQLDFSMNGQSLEIHDVYCEQEETDQIQNSLFLANIDRLTKEIACQFVLEQQQNEEQVKHLVMDFDEFDRDEVIRRYNCLIQKQNRTENSNKQSWINKDSIRSTKQTHIMQPQRIKELLQKKPMASSITITALQDQNNIYPVSHMQGSDHFKKKSLMSPSTARFSQHHGNHPYQKQPSLKRSSYYQYQLEHNNFPVANEFVIAEDEMEDSPKKISRHRQFPSTHSNQNVGYISSRDTNSGHKHYFNQAVGMTSPKPVTKYSSIINSSDFKTKSKIFNNYQREQRTSPFKGREQYDYGKEYVGYESARFGSAEQANRMTSINININNLQEKKEQHRVNVKVNSKNKYGFGEDFEEQEKNYRAQKKKKIREKAAALLNRVKSQQHVRMSEDFQYQMGEMGGKPYFQRYYN